MMPSLYIVSHQVRTEIFLCGAKLYSSLSTEFTVCMLLVYNV